MHVDEHARLPLLPIVRAAAVELQIIVDVVLLIDGLLSRGHGTSVVRGACVGRVEGQAFSGM
jgi:hypothetical protein